MLTFLSAQGAPAYENEILRKSANSRTVSRDLVSSEITVIG